MKNNKKQVDTSTKTNKEKYQYRVKGGKTDNTSTNQEGEVSEGTSSRLDTAYSVLHNKCTLLEHTV